jgi:hypothetical protein
MKLISVKASLARGVRPGSPLGALARWVARDISFPLVALAAFCVYWSSSLFLEARNATVHFGSDAPLYAWLAQGNAVDRVARFHPVTVVMELGWMRIVGPLAPWIAPQKLLKAMFAAVGAVGVWAAMSAFAAVVPRRYVALLGAIYAVSLGIWFFSSIEESKIVSATLTALYIAAYLRLRQDWTLGGALILTAILLVACLNEIVAGCLVLIPAIDTLVQRGWDLRHLRWIAWHALTAPIALLFLEGVVNGRLVAAGTDPEGASHFSMLMFYLEDSSFSAWTIYYFLVNWLLFNLAAPTPVLSHVFPHWPNNKYFDPVLANYLSSPVSICLVILFAAMLVASIVPWRRTQSLRGSAAILLALLAYALVRGVFFFVVHPYECLLFSSSVTLTHMLLISIPFAESGFPAKRALLASIAVLLFVINGTFIISQ